MTQGTSQIRNVAVVGHGGCGKTSLVSACLFATGATSRLGRIDDGTTPTDFDPDEIERKISLQSAVAFAEWRKVKINFIDAPGYANFFAEAKSALRVADAALFVVDAVAGVEVQTAKAWRVADEYGLPRLVVVNRMDRDRASYDRVLESLQKAFGRGCVPIAMPLGEEKAFVGDASLVSGQALVYGHDQSGKFQQVEVPEEVRARSAANREALIEMVAETNESLMEEFFEKGSLPAEDLLERAARGVPGARHLPGAASLVAAERRHPSDPRRHRRPRPVAGRARARHRATSRIRRTPSCAGPIPPSRSRRWCSRRSSTRTPGTSRSFACSREP